MKQLGNRRLPHWSQAGAVTFLTWRTADSIPQNLIREWKQERENWLINNGFSESNLEEPHFLEQLPFEVSEEFCRRFSKKWNDVLDRGLGKCLLGNPEYARVVGQSILHHDGGLYEIDSFVIMPNHVHILAAFREADDVLKQVESWKRFTARRINQLVKVKGRFWQTDCFDHLVRSRMQWEALQAYISSNPAKAGIKEGEFLLWKRTGSESSLGE